MRDTDSTRSLGFGPFQLLRQQRQLLQHGREVRLGSRALDVLIALVERAGEVLAKAELLARVWPNEVVEENTLRVHVAALRKALGDDQDSTRYIRSVPGRGYCFIAAVHRWPDLAVQAAQQEPRRTGGKLPTQTTRLVGREAAVDTLARHVRAHRLVTIVGAGGMGKTLVAVEVAQAVAGDYAHGAWFVDLSGVEPGREVAETLLSAVEAPNVDAAAPARLVDYLRTRQLLLVIDNCEHVVEHLALLLEQLQRAAPGVSILATSREPVRAEGERVHLLPPLECPPVDAPPSAEAVASFPAAQLFIASAQANDDQFALGDHNAPAVADICRQLNGIPLAIKLVGALVRVFGVAGLAAGLDAKFLEMHSVQHAAATRHQTLHAMLDWSHQLLSTTEKTVLRRMSIFRGKISLDTIVALACDPQVKVGEVQEALLGLVSKSWLYPHASSDGMHFEMHGIARTFAVRQLRSAGEFDALNRRHADHLRKRMGQAADDWVVLAKNEWLARHGHLSQDLRAAIAWTLVQENDPVLAAAMMADGWMLGLLLFQFAEYEALANAILQQLAVQDTAPLAQMRIHRALALLAGPYVGAQTRRSNHTERALELAQSHGDVQDLMQARMARFVHDNSRGEIASALLHAQELSDLAQAAGDLVAALVSERMCAQAWHFMGDHDRSDAAAERVLNHRIRRGAFGAPSGPTDHAIAMQILKVRTLWLRGRADQATAVCARLLAQAEDDGVMSLCQVIAVAALPLAMWKGDTTGAHRLLDLLDADSVRRSTGGVWAPWARGVRGILRPGADRPWCAAQVTEAANPNLVDHLATFHPLCSNERSFRRVQTGTVGWCAPEVLRIRALQLQEQRQAGTPGETLLLAALDQARRQGALAWELRIATSFATLVSDGARRAQGRDLLEATCAQFSEGLQTADFRTAHHQLSLLR